MYRTLRFTTILSLLFGLCGYAHAITIDFDFTGECDDCAFNGNPGDIGFDPLNDGLTETVTARLSLDGLSVDGNGMIVFADVGTATFTYNGSSLINPFTMGDPYNAMDNPFIPSAGLLTTGVVADGFEFNYASTINLTDPNDPMQFSFPNFCTDLGQLVGSTDCNNIGDVTFRLDSAGDWSIRGLAALDIGGSGQFTVSSVPVPAAVWLFGSGLIGLAGMARLKKA